MDSRLIQGYSHAIVPPFSKDGASGVDILRSRTTSLMCRLQNMQSFHQRMECKRRLTRACRAGTKNVHSSEKLGWQNKTLNFPENSIAAVRTFPWEKVYGRFSQRVLSLVWITTKWLAIPVLVLSAVSELLYTLSAGKEIFIPLGLLIGVMLAKIVGNASLDILKELQDVRSAWPLVVLGMFFVLLKLPGPYYPSWAAVFFPHVANAGLVQTAFLFREAHQIFG